jgi:hypothetical protein
MTQNTKDAVPRAEVLRIIETYRVSVGNSAAGAIACEMTMANLKDIRDAVQALAPTAEQADAVRVDSQRIPVNLTYEQISALYLLLFRRERPAYGWMETPLVAIEQALSPAHSAIHDRGPQRQCESRSRRRPGNRSMRAQRLSATRITGVYAPHE